jgi:hypothetical protein
VGSETIPMTSWVPFGLMPGDIELGFGSVTLAEDDC